MTPLHAAVEHMNLSAIRHLIAAGADINAPDSSLSGARPLHLAVDIECEECLRRQDAGEADAIPVSTASKLLWDAGANPELPDHDGRTAIDWAREHNHAQALVLFSVPYPRNES